MLADADIVAIIGGAASLAMAAELLVARANEQGGRDNISVA